MSFSAEQFVSRLNNLEDSQESIGNASKWLLSQYRDASKVAEFWKNYMLRKDINTRRKLLAIYLVNHVVQQAKAKKIGQFQTALGHVTAEVLREVYPVLPRDLKKKVRRVCDIWRDRCIFSEDVLSGIKSCLDSEETVSASTPIPPKLTPLVESFDMLDRMEQNAKAMKLRFDNAIGALDPSSVVYEENFGIVAKIGQTAIDTANQSIQLREHALSRLKSLLELEKKLLDEERNTIGEMDIAIASRNSASVNQGAEYEEDILPTYEAGNEDDEDDEQNNSSSSNSSDSDDGDSGKDISELDNNIVSTNKRQHELSSDNSQAKKPKSSSEDIDGRSVQEYEPESLPNNSNSPRESGTSGVTSNIQDLLSKLAN